MFRESGVFDLVDFFHPNVRGIGASRRLLLPDDKQLIRVFFRRLKAFTSVAVLVMSVAFGLEQMQSRKFIIVVAISCGGQSCVHPSPPVPGRFKLTTTMSTSSVALASYGEIAFDLRGFIFQALGIAFEAARLVCIQKLLTGLKMGPVSQVKFRQPRYLCPDELTLRTRSNSSYRFTT